MKTKMHNYPAAECPCLHHTMMRLPFMMAGGSAGPVDSGPRPSFSDKTPQEPSTFALAGDQTTSDLFDILERDETLVIENASVLPMTDTARLDRHDVLVRDGRILDVQAHGAPSPDGARRIDGSGKFLIPGLTDVHMHPSMLHLQAIFGPMLAPDAAIEDITMPYDLQMFASLAGGITRIGIMAGSAEELALREGIRSGRLRGPALSVASPVVDGYPPLQGEAISYLVNDADGARLAAQKIAEMGFDFCKPYSMLTREAYFALVEECRALGIRLIGHIPWSVTPEEALGGNQHGGAHIFELVYNDEGADRGNPDVMARRARIAAENGSIVQTTYMATATFEYNIGNRPGHFDPTMTVDRLLQVVMKDDSPFIEMWRNNEEYKKRGQDILQLSYDIGKALRAEGVPLLPGTDFPNGSGTSDYTVHSEYEHMVNGIGMTPLEVLKAATIECAEFHGEGQDYGTIEPGKRADMILLENDPTKDIRATRSIDRVILGDAMIDQDSIEKGMSRVKSFYASLPY